VACLADWGFGDGDGSLTNWVCDVSCREECITSVAAKGVQLFMWWRIHQTEELVEEASLD